jgi:hypothetical protein
MPGSGQTCRAQVEFRQHRQAQRQAQERLGWHADFRHQAQQLAVGTDQQMLAVVEHALAAHHFARATA